ncbi:hypothetical protein LOD99_7857 [Oopsacas minuta]|uniref:Transposase n=1 Tax=Oopsacas minuta TaxID=111878 RepID=A0AAV7JQ26_9METZ|nr:hypothetical protein LOD99_7857 [Oopsacas minuta]
MNPQPIGGSGKIVEIDESKFGKRKYNRGRLLTGQWVFGMVERDTDDIIMVTVPDRSTATLLPIIQRPSDSRTHPDDRRELGRCKKEADKKTDNKS